MTEIPILDVDTAAFKEFFFRQSLQNAQLCGFTAQEMAGWFGVSRTTIRRWLSGNGYPNVATVVVATRLVNTEVDTRLADKKHNASFMAAKLKRIADTLR